MGVKKFFRTKIVEPVLHLFGDAHAEADAATVTDKVVNIVLTDAEKLSAFLRTSTIGTAIANTVSDVVHGKNPDGSPMSGTQKAAAALKDLMPAATALLLDASPTLAGAANSASLIEDALRDTIQGSFNVLESAGKDLLHGVLEDLGIE